MYILRSCSITVALVLACCAGSHAAVLYDGSANTLPTAQGWTYGTVPLPPPFGPGASATQSASGGATTLDTTPVQTDLAGYFSDTPLTTAHPDIDALDSSVGFTVLFTVQLVSEDHSGFDDRAGFSVIVIDSASEGVELGFWTDEIWAQTASPLHTHSTTEKKAFNTTTALTQYQLAFQGSTYSLSSGGSELFNGDLKDYSAFDHTAAGLPMDPYETPNFIFFGDDTSSASAKVNISHIELVPEPATAAVLLVGFAASLARRRKRPAA